MGHGGALAQEQGPVVAEVVVIPGVLNRLDLQVLRGVPGNGQSLQAYRPLIGQVLQCYPLIGQMSQYWPLTGQW